MDENVVRLAAATPLRAGARRPANLPARASRRDARHVQLRVDLEEDIHLLERQLKLLHDAAGRALAMAKDVTHRRADEASARTYMRGVLMATNRALNAHRRPVEKE